MGLQARYANLQQETEDWEVQREKWQVLFSIRGCGLNTLVAGLNSTAQNTFVVVVGTKKGKMIWMIWKQYFGFESSKIPRRLLFLQFEFVLWSCANWLFNWALEAGGRQKLSWQSKTRILWNAKSVCGNASVNMFFKQLMMKSVVSQNEPNANPQTSNPQNWSEVFCQSWSPRRILVFWLLRVMWVMR